MPSQRGTKQQTRTQRHSTSKPFVLQKLRRQDLILLTGALSLACLSVITVGFLILRFQPDPQTPDQPFNNKVPGVQPTHTVTYLQITGLNQYPLAEAEAKVWATDAQLVEANAHWPQVLSKEQVGQPGQWTYRFYSPGKERLFIVKIDADGRVRSFEHVIKITLPPPLLTGADAWGIDSPAALATWLDNGGADLVLRNPGLEVLIQLRNLENYASPVWLVVGTDKRTQDIHVIVVDAIKGGLVPINPAS